MARARINPLQSANDTMLICHISAAPFSFPPHSLFCADLTGRPFSKDQQHALFTSLPTRLCQVQISPVRVIHSLHAYGEEETNKVMRTGFILCQLK